MEATRLASWLRRFLPGQPTVGWNERVRASVGTFLGLVPLMRESGFGHIPVVDERRRLVGIVSQADVIAALYDGGVGAP